MDNLNELEIRLSNESRIISFLRGEMTPEEEKQFLEIVDANPEFKSDAITIARLAKGIKQVGEEKDLLLKKVLMASWNRFVNKEDITRETLREVDNYELSENDMKRMYNQTEENDTNNVEVEEPTKKFNWIYVIICLLVVVSIIAVILLFCC